MSFGAITFFIFPLFYYVYGVAYHERYAKDISRKIRSNLKHKISHGEFLGKPPYGYTKCISQKNTLQIDPEQAEIVKQIYKMYLDGFGYSKIANYFNEKKVSCPAQAKGLFSPAPKWNSVAIQRILSNRVYLGETIQGVSEKISFKSKKTRRLPEEKWVITPNTHEPIIDEDTFLKAEKIRNSKKTNFTCSDKGIIHTYRGTVFCGRCNKIMFARKRKDRELGYVCQTYMKYGKEACSTHFVKESQLNEIVAKEFLAIKSNKKIFEELNDLLKKVIKNSNKKINTEIVSKKLDSLKGKQEKIYLDMIEGIITKELFIRLNKNMEENIERLTNELNEYSKYKPVDYDLEVIIDQIIDLCEKNMLPFQLAQLLVKKITIFDKGECLQSEVHGENIQMENTDGIVLVEFNI